MPDTRKSESRRSRKPAGPRRRNEPQPEQISDRAPAGGSEDVDRGQGGGRHQEGVESVPREGEVSETGGRQADSSPEEPWSPGRQTEGESEKWPAHREPEPAAPQGRGAIDERQRIRETAPRGKA
jgi:hypothetical protein